MNNIQVGQKNRAQNVENQNISRANDANNGKFDYIRPLSPLNRLVKLINALVITLFTGFLALAFKDVRNLWSEGFTGKEIVAISLNNPESEVKNFISQIKNLSEKNQVLENQIRFLNESLQENNLRSGSQENPYQQQQIHQLKLELGNKNQELLNLNNQIIQLNKQKSSETAIKLNQANTKKQNIERTIRDLQEQINKGKLQQNNDKKSYENQLNQLHLEKENLKTELKQEVNKLHSAIDVREEKIHELQNKLKDNSKLYEANNKFIINKKNKEHEAYQEQIKQLTVEIEQLRNLLNAAKKEHEELDQVKNTNLHLHSIIHQLQNKLNPLEKAYEQLKAESKGTESQELAKLAGLNKKLEGELSKEIKRIETLEDDKKDLEDTNGWLKKQMDNVMIEFNKAKSELATLQQENNKILLKYNTLHADSNTLNTRWNEVNDECNILAKGKKEQEAQLQKIIKEQEEKIAQAEKQIQYLSDEKTLLQDDIQSQALLINDLGAKLIAEQSKKNVVDNSKDQAELKANYDKEIVKLNNKIKELEDNEKRNERFEQDQELEIGKLQKKIRGLEEEYKKDTKALTLDKIELENQITVISERNSDLNKTVNKYFVEIEDLKENVANQAKTLDELNAQLIGRQSKEMVSTDSQLAYEQEISKLKSEISRLENEISKIAKPQELANLKNENQQLRDTISQLENKMVKGLEDNEKNNEKHGQLPEIEELQKKVKILEEQYINDTNELIEEVVNLKAQLIKLKNSAT